MPKLNKPPIVEAWIGVQLAPGPSVWDADDTRRFLREHAPDFNEFEIEIENIFTLKKAPAGKLPKIARQSAEIREVKASRKDGSRSIEVNKSRLIYTVLDAAKSYPGFEQMLLESLEVIKPYLAYTERRQILSAALCYKDVIQCPTIEGRVERLADYFKLCAEPPEEPFGAIKEFGYTNVFTCPTDPGDLIYNLQPLFDPSEDSVAKFSMTWLKTCDNVNSEDLALLSDRLRASNEYLHRCFRASVTDLAWQTFEPQG